MNGAGKKCRWKFSTTGFTFQVNSFQMKAQS